MGRARYRRLALPKKRLEDEELTPPYRRGNGQLGCPKAGGRLRSGACGCDCAHSGRSGGRGCRPQGDFTLPGELIAQHACIRKSNPGDQSRLMVIRAPGATLGSTAPSPSFPVLDSGDLLVRNDTRGGPGPPPRHPRSDRRGVGRGSSCEQDTGGTWEILATTRDARSRNRSSSAKGSSGAGNTR